jgi:hypothetical protein
MNDLKFLPFFVPYSNAGDTSTFQCFFLIRPLTHTCDHDHEMIGKEEQLIPLQPFLFGTRILTLNLIKHYAMKA